ncbi:hypothetical protein B0A49_04681 [Cryomyces minteri]|uniref:STE24 endopeptidase n=1 Tax=Cryomyces minteri TaxID=331657 RepID=A0A4U0WSS5_9PEZI|nr:hypothetical protein B0A49_07677 [Cryomyces minteri]TKA65646.1 hypothetical protein B0A49_04681 [Cryomyces minteri]
MPTPLDRALQSRNAFLGFAGIITAVAAWTIWGPSDVFPRAGDPVGDPESWTDDELRRWLEARKLYPGSTSTREELMARVEANMRAPRV